MYEYIFYIIYIFHSLEIHSTAHTKKKEKQKEKRKKNRKKSESDIQSGN